MTKGLLLLTAILYTHCATYGQWNGTVLSEDGSPLKGVRVCSETWSCSLSRDDGSFSHSLSLPGADVLNFSLAGFVPRSVVVGETEKDMTVTLKAGIGTWTIETCPSRSSHSFFAIGFGGTLGVKVPKRAKVVRFRDVDYGGAWIRYSSKEALQIGGGSTWSKGLPHAKNLSSSKEVIERVLVFPSRNKDTEYPSISGVDARGVSLDGKHWRFTGDISETLVYNGVSAEAAKFFDAIIDTLCECSK